MSRDSNPVTEIDISTNWHTVPISGDLLANETNDLASLSNRIPLEAGRPRLSPD